MAATAKNPNANRANQFGSFAHDVNHQVITLPNYPYYQDVNASPVKSPLSITTTPALITIPGAAVSITLTSTVAFRTGDQSAIDSTKPYATWPANTPITLPCVTPSSDPLDTTGVMYVAADTASGVLSFIFNCL